MKLHFGAGGNILPGWENLDLQTGFDVRETPFSQWSDNSIEACFACHLFEHLASPDALRFLDECHRVLQPGGWIRLCCPVVDQRLTVTHARDLLINHGHLMGLNQEMMETFLWAAGFQQMVTTERYEIDGHWKVIGKEKDDLETCRMMAVKKT